MLNRALLLVSGLTVTLAGCATGRMPTVPELDASTPALSQEALAYARNLGGSSHQGETLFLVVGASAASETEALRLLDEALPLFGDMQSYFVVQLSDNFEGMTPGRWIVIEAYTSEPSPENLEFAGRAFPDATVEQACRCPSNTKLHSSQNCPPAGFSPLLEIFSQHFRAIVGAMWY